MSDAMGTTRIDDLVKLYHAASKANDATATGIATKAVQCLAQSEAAQAEAAVLTKFLAGEIAG